MTPSAIDLPTKSTIITWKKLPDDFILPDEPVDNIKKNKEKADKVIMILKTREKKF